MPSGKSAAKLSHRLRSQDASFLYGETRNGPLHIGCITWFDGRIDRDDFVAHMESRMHLLPRYRQRLVSVPFNLAHATLEDDPAFEVRNHVYSHSLPPGTDEEQLKAAMDVFAPALDRSRPLWETHLFEGLTNGGTAILWKMHHCLVDGVSGMELLSASLDLRPDSPHPSVEPFRPGPLPGPAKSLVLGILDSILGRLNDSRSSARLIRDPWAAARRVARAANIVGRLTQMLLRPIVAAPWNARLITTGRLIAYFRLPFADVRAVRNVYRGTANDVVLAILSEAAARYLDYHGIRAEGIPLRIGCPVSVRRGEEHGALGNRVSMMFVECRSTPMEVSQRLAAVIAEIAKIKAAGEAGALESLLETSSWVPPVMVGVASKLATRSLDTAVRLSEAIPAIPRTFKLLPPGINFLVTNVPGAQLPLYLAGRRMTGMIGCVPLAANLGYSVAIVSYNHELAFGFMAEPNAMPDVHRMRDFAAEVFDEMIGLATQKRCAVRARFSIGRKNSSVKDRGEPAKRTGMT